MFDSRLWQSADGMVENTRHLARTANVAAEVSLEAIWCHDGTIVAPQVSEVVQVIVTNIILYRIFLNFTHHF